MVRRAVVRGGGLLLALTLVGACATPATNDDPADPAADPGPTRRGAPAAPAPTATATATPPRPPTTTPAAPAPAYQVSDGRPRDALLSVPALGLRDLRVVAYRGHTDDAPLSGTGRYRDNWELSQARALAVVRHMVDALGFPPDRVAAAGFGEHRPAAPGSTSEARAQNRRIELKLTER